MDRLRVDLTPIAFLVTIAQYNSLKASASEHLRKQWWQAFLIHVWGKHGPIQRTDNLCPSSVPDQLLSCVYSPSRKDLVSFTQRQAHHLVLLEVTMPN